MKLKQAGEKLENIVKVIFFILLILTVIVCPIIFFHGLSKDTKTDNEKKILVELYTGYNFHIVYDEETGIEYYRAEGVMVPLYNPDGTFKTYRKA